MKRGDRRERLADEHEMNGLGDDFHGSAGSGTVRA
jgi:hypothetical protein